MLIASTLLKKLSFLTAAFLILLSVYGCETTEPLADPPATGPEVSVFVDDYDQIWRAIQLAVRKYPVRLNNIESGLLETDFVKGDKIFADPSEGGPPKNNVRYKINIRAVKVKSRDDGRSGTKIIISKVMEIQPDFFTGFKEIPSNGLEEQTIMYRIGRYLEMDRRLSQAAKQTNE
jgi:hypothetical protein